MWTYYSMLNGVVKSKYGYNLKSYPRVTALLKSMDTDVKKKAETFDKTDIDSFVFAKDRSTPYWLVRKVKLVNHIFSRLCC